MTAGQPRIPRDPNRVPLLGGVSSSDLQTPVPVAVDPSTNRLLVTSNGTTVPTATDGGTINTTFVTMGGISNAGYAKELLLDPAGRMKISHGQPSPVGGSLSAVDATVAVIGDGFSDVIFYFMGTTVQTVTFEQSPDSTNGTDGNWYPVLGTSQSSNTQAATTASLTGTATYRISAPAGSYIRVRTTAYTSGLSTVMAVTTTASAQPQISAVVTSVPTTTVTPAISTSASGFTSRYFNAALTAVATVKASSGSIVYMNFYNPNATVVYMQLFNNTTATLGTTTPTFSIAVPPNANYDITFPYYNRHTTGITIGPWSVPGNSAGSAPGTGLVVNIGYA